jgi:hypothetical protein
MSSFGAIVGLRLRGGTLAVHKQQWFPASPMRASLVNCTSRAARPALQDAKRS